MEDSLQEVSWTLPVSDFEKLTIIPTSYSRTDGKEYYNDSAMSFYKYAKNKTEIEIYSTPDVCLVQKSEDWFGPVFYITNLAIENYEMLSSLVELISSYLDGRYGDKEVNAKFEIVSKNKNKGTYNSIKYEGSSKNIKTVLKSFDKLKK